MAMISTCAACSGKLKAQGLDGDEGCLPFCPMNVNTPLSDEQKQELHRELRQITQDAGLMNYD